MNLLRIGVLVCVLCFAGIAEAGVDWVFQSASEQGGMVIVTLKDRGEPDPAKRKTEVRRYDVSEGIANIRVSIQQVLRNLQRRDETVADVSTTYQVNR